MNNPERGRKRGGERDAQFGTAIAANSSAAYETRAQLNTAIGGAGSRDTELQIRITSGLALLQSLTGQQFTSAGI